MASETFTYACPADSALRDILGKISDQEQLFPKQLIEQCQRILDEHKLEFIRHLSQEAGTILDLCKQQVDDNQLRKIEATLMKLIRLASLFGYQQIQDICERTGELLQSDKVHELSEQRKFDLLANVGLLMGLLCEQDKHINQ